MGLHYRDLNAETRSYMLQESKHGFHYQSPLIRVELRHKWIPLLEEALEKHSDEWLKLQLINHNIFVTSAVNKNGVRRQITPSASASTLAEGEFNRFYLRGLCALAIVKDIKTLTIYRGKTVSEPRPDSERKIGAEICVNKLLNDLRTSDLVSISEKLSVSGGPNSGLTAGFRIPTDPVSQIDEFSSLGNIRF